MKKSVIELIIVRVTDISTKRRCTYSYGAPSPNRSCRRVTMIDAMLDGIDIRRKIKLDVTIVIVVFLSLLAAFSVSEPICRRF